MHCIICCKMMYSNNFNTINDDFLQKICITKFQKNKYEMYMKIFKCITLLLVLAGSLVSCKNSSDSSDANSNVTGKIIGYYSNGFYSLLIQVDKKYKIGETLDYEGVEPCLKMPKAGAYQNMIQVQAPLPVAEMTSKMMDKKISFTYRTFSSEEDGALFNFGIGIAICGIPDVPIYVITNYQILN